MFLFLYETTTIPLSNHHRTYVLPCSFRPSRYFPTRYVLLRSLNPYTSEHASGFPTLLFLLITRLPFLNPPLSKNPSKFLLASLLDNFHDDEFFAETISTRSSRPRFVFNYTPTLPHLATCAIARRRERERERGLKKNGTTFTRDSPRSFLRVGIKK